MRKGGMHKTVVSIVVLMLSVIPVTKLRGQEKSDADRVRTLEMQLTELYKQRKIEGVAALLDDDFVITFEDGKVYSKTGYISYNAAASLRILEAETLDVKVHLHGNTAVLTGIYHERGEEKGTPYDYRDRFTDVWMKKDGKWRIIASHYATPVKN